MVIELVSRIGEIFSKSSSDTIDSSLSSTISSIISSTESSVPDIPYTSSTPDPSNISDA